MEWSKAALVWVLRGWRGDAMSSGFNSAVILGRRIATPERIQTKSGSVMLKATLEVSTYRRSADGSGEEQTTKLPVTLFGKLATTFEQYVEVGPTARIGSLPQLRGRFKPSNDPGRVSQEILTHRSIIWANLRNSLFERSK